MDTAKSKNTFLVRGILDSVRIVFLSLLVYTVFIVDCNGWPRKSIALKSVYGGRIGYHLLSFGTPQSNTENSHVSYSTNLLQFGMWLQNISFDVTRNGSFPVNIYCDYSIRKDGSSAVGIFAYFPLRKVENDTEEELIGQINHLHHQIKVFEMQLKSLYIEETSLQNRIRNSPIYVKEICKSMNLNRPISHVNAEQKRLLSSRRRDVELNIKALGDRHWKTAKSWYSLGFLFEEFGQLRESILSLSNAFDAYNASLGETHPTTLCTLLRLGKLQRAVGCSSAIATLIKARDGLRQHLGADNRLVVEAEEAIDPSVIETQVNRFKEAVLSLHDVHSKMAIIQRNLHRIKNQLQSSLSANSGGLSSDKEAEAVYSLLIQDGKLFSRATADIVTGYIMSVITHSLSNICNVSPNW